MSSLFARPEDAAEVVGTLKLGQPILVLGESKGPWLHVLGTDGSAGWAHSLDVRMIAE